MPLYEHVPHPHVKTRKPPRPVHEHRAAGKHWLGRIGAVVGLRITLIVGTMTVAVLFTGLALVSLPAALKSGDKIIIVAWIAQTLIQLVLLPIIIVGQNVQSKAADERGDATYKDAEAVLAECIKLQEHLQAQDGVLERLIGEERPQQPGRGKTA